MTAFIDKIKTWWTGFSAETFSGKTLVIVAAVALIIGFIL